jgi:hypothetical protein
MVLKPAVKYQQIAKTKGIPRGNYSGACRTSSRLNRARARTPE